MAISFGNRKVKIKLIEKPVTTEETEMEIPYSVFIEEEKAPEKQSSPFSLTSSKNILDGFERVSLQQLHLSDFTAYLFEMKNDRYYFKKLLGDSVFSEITLEKYISISKPTVFRPATGLPDAPEFRSRLVVLCRIDNKNCILVWSSILYEAFTEELLAKINALLMYE